MSELTDERQQEAMFALYAKEHPELKPYFLMEECPEWVVEKIRVDLKAVGFWTEAELSEIRSRAELKLTRRIIRSLPLSIDDHCPKCESPGLKRSCVTDLDGGTQLYRCELCDTLFRQIGPEVTNDDR